MNFLVLFQLLLAHLLADFVLQTDSMCAGKRKKGAAGLAWLALHSLLHALSACLLVGIWSEWRLPVAVFVTHFLTDYVKSAHMRESVRSFVADQCVHLLVIVALWLCLFCGDGSAACAWAAVWSNPDVWIVLVAYLSILRPAAILLQLFIRQWTPTDDKGRLSLPKAGLWIGYMERLLILTFIFVGRAEGIGFLLAAKSIFRFGELKKAGEIKVTEYVLIGTLASFSVATLVGVVAVRLMQ